MLRTIWNESRLYVPDLLVLLAACTLLLLRHRRDGWRRLLVYAVFGIYLAGVLWVTVLPVLALWDGFHAYTPMNLTPFRDLLAGYGGAVRQLLLNILMTLPFGLLWPVVRRGHAGFLSTVLAAFLLSLSIELVQPLLPTNRTADITDLLCNTLGGALGYCLYRPWRTYLRCWMVSPQERGSP